MQDVYDGWRVIEELDVLGAVTRQYTWGRDLSRLSPQGRSLSGSLEGAGGIGVLLAVHDVNLNEDYVYASDAMGNIGQLVALADDYGSATGSAWDDSRMVAKYEYDPYGNVVGPDSDGDGFADAFDDDTPYAAANAYRFSTKPQHAETGLSYFGYRYYNARLGRWINRDPIEELGGRNLYVALRNTPVRLYPKLIHHQGECSGVIRPGTAGVGTQRTPWGPGDQGAVGTLPIVMPTPRGDLRPRVVQRQEPVLVQTLGPQPTVEGFGRELSRTASISPLSVGFPRRLNSSRTLFKYAH